MLIKTLNGGIKLKTNKIHGLNTIFLLSVVERFGSAVGYYFNEMVGREKRMWDVERLSNFESENDKILYSKITSRKFW